ncbi:type II toxin-antitoxin system death-on-curing family toxin [Chromobacterium violaceum]|uniref:type II toxin-antitoxin system death-on-curing family toxin n=1 Tax=Chromobacterium violaceum TaxID=536 RepID=UPI0009B8CEDF|nr:type II toxin-antitoxin system death-on-curing family toxin [Chromobacterium violaceum]
MTWLPSPESVEEIHFSLAKLFEMENDPISPAGIKSRDMLESACDRPNTGIGSVCKYNSLEEKVGVLFHSLTKNHPFHNGNKRTALVSLITALYRNDRVLKREVTDNSIYDFVVAVTANKFPTADHGLDVDNIVNEIAKWIKHNTMSIRIKPIGMKTRLFIDKCLAAGAHCKNASGGAYVVSFKKASIRISKSTKQLNGNVIRNYLSQLGLSERDTGVSVGEFQDGVNQERDQISRYIVALRRLART